MITRIEKFYVTRQLAAFFVVIVMLLPLALSARPATDTTGEQTYIIELQDPAIPSYEGQTLSAPLDDGRSRLQATNPRASGKKRLNASEPGAREYLHYLEGRHQAFESEAAVMLAREISADRRYHYALNGMAVRLTPSEAELLFGS